MSTLHPTDGITSLGILSYASLSSCGVCGSRKIEEILAELDPVGTSLRVPASLLIRMSEKMRSLQSLFAQTGGSHAAGIFTAKGDLLAFAEDIGRHNALDKAIGKCLLMGRDMRGSGAILSGRVSFELVMKCVRAGIELIAAVSAPTSLAVEIARRCQVTLVGFVRGSRVTAVAHPERIVGFPDEMPDE